MIKQEFISYRQSLIKGNETSDQQSNKVCTLSFYDGTYNIELPTGRIINGEMFLKEVKNGNEVYETDTGCVLFISIDKIFFNLYRTDNMAVSFYLPNYKDPSFAEKVTANLESKYELDKKIHGEFVANCILERKVVTGLKVTDVLAILGVSKDVWLKKINSKLEVAICIYEDYYVLFHNSVVVYVEHF